MPLSNSYHQFAAGGKGIDGAGTTSDSVPNFSEPIDFTFHEQAFTLLVGSSGSGKSSLFQMIAQAVSSL